MTFHSIVRHWCKIYKYMRDDEENNNRRFYLTDSTAGLVEMVKNLSNAFSPCVVMESTIEGSGPITRISRCYPIYFFVRARDMADGDCAAEAKEEAWYHCRNFLTWLKAEHDKEIDEGRRDGDFGRIDIDNAIIDIVTVGPQENGWFGVLVQFEREEPLNLCVDKDLYDETDDSY